MRSHLRQQSLIYSQFCFSFTVFGYDDIVRQPRSFHAFQHETGFTVCRLLVSTSLSAFKRVSRVVCKTQQDTRAFWESGARQFQKKKKEKSGKQ